MKPDALLIHTSSELKKVFESYPDLKNSCDIYFLTADVDYTIMNEIGITNYNFFDYGIDFNKLKELHSQATHIADSWYLEKDQTDITMIENFSIGRCFHQFFSHTFCLTLKYIAFLKNINENYHHIITTNTSNSLLEILLSENIILKDKIKKLPIIDLSNPFIPSTVINFKSHGFNTFFPKIFSLKNFIKKYLIFFYMKFKNTKKIPNKVFFVTAGKSKDLVQNYTATKKDRKVNFILSLNSESFSFNFRNLYYEISSSSIFSKKKTVHLMDKIKEKIVPYGEISTSIILKIVEKYLANYFEEIFSYYQASYDQLKSLTPDLVLLSAESHETNIIIAQAAKNLKLKTCMIPHGITMPLLSTQYYKGSNLLYDSAFLFSQSSTKAYIQRGFKEDDLYVSSFYYFSKFLPFSSLPLEIENIQSALILPPDFTDYTNERYSIAGTQKAIDTCIDLRIPKIAIKARIEAQLKSMFISNNKLHYKDLEIDIYSGYTSFPQYAKNSDIVIGPPSSATIESLLMGIPYFCFQEPDALIGLWEYSNIDEILYIARTTAELQDNIKNNRVFRKSKTVDDLIFISNTNDKDEFIQMFETAVLKCIGQKEKK